MVVWGCIKLCVMMWESLVTFGEILVKFCEVLCEVAINFVW